MRFWTPVSTDTPLSELWAQSLYADAPDGRAMVFSIALPPAGGKYARLAPEPDARVQVQSYANFGLQRQQDDLLPDYLPVTAPCIRRGFVPHRVVLAPRPLWRFMGAPTLDTPDGPLSFHDLVRHGPPASVRLQGALAMADDVKTTYGRMLTDIAYRIEQSALFDSTVPTTRSFDNALAVWDDLDHTTASEDDVVRLAGTLKLALQTARAHAETVGLDHLPATARADARRAAGAARLAAGAKTEPERRAAQEQVIRILKSLALYYLPDPDSLPAALPAPPR